jgi:hypothetical protein
MNLMHSDLGAFAAVLRWYRVQIAYAQERVTCVDTALFRRGRFAEHQAMHGPHKCVLPESVSHRV